MYYGAAVSTVSGPIDILAYRAISILGHPDTQQNVWLGFTFISTRGCSTDNAGNNAQESANVVTIVWNGGRKKGKIFSTV